MKVQNLRVGTLYQEPEDSGLQGRTIQILSIMELDDTEVEVTYLWVEVPNAPSMEGKTHTSLYKKSTSIALVEVLYCIDEIPA